MRQALEMALDWIEKQPEETPDSKYDLDTRYVVLRELEAALAQPKQEPLALQYQQKDIDWQQEQQIKAQASTPPQRTWVGLTDEEMEEVRKQAVDLFVQEVKTTGKGRNEPIKFGRLVEAKLKEKNNGT